MATPNYPPIFISYSRIDSDFVDKLQTDLEAHKVNVWIDRRRLEGTQVWASEIEKGINNAELVVIVLTPDSVRSEWVQKEIAYAQQKRKLILPIMWRQTDVPVTIVDLQFIVFENRYDAALAELLTILSKITVIPPSPQLSSPPAIRTANNTPVPLVHPRPTASPIGSNRISYATPRQRSPYTESVSGPAPRPKHTTTLIKLYTQVLGVVLTLVGILGFFSPLRPETSSAPHGALLGIFAIDPLHNVIHLASGVVGLLAANLAAGQYARIYAGVFGAVYALVTVVGFIQGTTVLGLISVNLADNLLHAAIAIASLAVFFAAPSNNAATMQTA